MNPQERLREVMALVTQLREASTAEESLLLRTLIAVRVASMLGLSAHEAVATLRPRMHLARSQNADG